MSGQPGAVQCTVGGMGVSRPCSNRRARVRAGSGKIATTAKWDFKLWWRGGGVNGGGRPHCRPAVLHTAFAGGGSLAASQLGKSKYCIS